MKTQYDIKKDRIKDMENYCGVNCTECAFNSSCKGCINTDGNPFGSGCISAFCIKNNGKDKFKECKNNLISEINGMNISGMGKVTELFSLPGFYVNLEYELPNGKKVKFLDDNRVYLGSQVESTNGDGLCYGVVCDREFVLISTYEENGVNPKLVTYKKR